MSPRGAGAMAGAGVGLALAGAIAVSIATQNPWFLDDAVSYAVLAGGSLALLGALAGALSGRRPRTWLRWVPALAGVGLIGLARLWPAPGPVGIELLVFGIDGATWSLTDKVPTPTLDRLAQTGAKGTLLATEPMFSPLLWTTIATGKTPDEHGVRGFRTRSDHCRAARFWDVAAAEGLSTGVYKWLVTWPPTRPGPRGFVVPSWLAPSPETEPESLSFVKELELTNRLRRKQVAARRPSWRLVLAGIPQGLRWSTVLDAALWSLRERLRPSPPLAHAAELHLLRVRIDRDVFIAAMHRYRPELATFTTYAPDALGHTHWHLMEACSKGPCSAVDAAVPRAVAQADAVLAEVIDALAPARILVLSDHGFRAAEEGDAAVQFAPKTERLRARMAEVVGPLDAARMGHKVVVTLQGDDPVAQRAAAEAFLQGLTRSSTGEPFFVWEDIGPGALGLTLRLELVDPATMGEDRVGGEPLDDYARPTEAFTGVHDAQGILLAHGVGVNAESLGEIAQVDVAPTILGWLGLPAAGDMPGRALFGEPMPRVDSYDALAPAHGARGYEAMVNEDALRELGYIE